MKTFREHLEKELQDIVADSVRHAIQLERDAVVAMIEESAREARSTARQHMDESAILGWISAAEYLAQRVRSRNPPRQ